MATSQRPAQTKGKGVATTEAKRRVDAFVIAYGRTGNATQAAKDSGYSAHSAGQQGSALLKKPEISERCAKARAEFLAQNENAKKRQREALELAADDAIVALRKVVTGKIKRGAVAIVSASTAILDRAGHKPVDESKVDHRSSDGSMTPSNPPPTKIIIEGK